MSHMQAQMTRKREWLEVDGPMGTEWVDLEDLDKEKVRRFMNIFLMSRKGIDPKPVALGYAGGVGDHFENREAWEAKIVKGYGVRSSAPGYMDATPWVVYTSLKDARKAYNEEKRALRGQDW